MYASHCFDMSMHPTERFLVGDFLKDAFFVSTKDRLVRGLETFFSSRRADSLGIYYRDALLKSKDGSINESRLQVEGIDMEALREHHTSIVENTEVLLDCLFTGNVSAMMAKSLFSEVDAAICSATKSSPETRPSLSFVPGKFSVTLEVLAVVLANVSISIQQQPTWNVESCRRKISSFIFRVKILKKKMGLWYSRTNHPFPLSEAKDYHMIRV